MTQTISRMYRSHDEAARAAAALKDYGYTHVQQVSRPEGSEDEAQAHNSIVASLIRGYIWRPHAEVYAKSIKDGGSLVTVHAPFGAANDAEQILDKHDPIHSGLPAPKHRSPAWDEKTPMSSILQMPVLAKNKLPMSTVWNVPPVIKSATVSGCLGMRTLSQSKTPLSSSFGLPALSRNATPISSLLGLPVLSDAPRRK
jgi:hypothetical protein